MVREEKLVRQVQEERRDIQVASDFQVFQVCKETREPGEHQESPVKRVLKDQPVLKVLLENEEL